MDDKLTLATAKRMCIRHEAVKKQQCLLKGEASSAQLVEAVTTTTKKYSQAPTSQMSHTPTPARTQLEYKNRGWCGKSSHNRQACPAKDATCRNCGKRGHFTAIYRSNPAVTAEVQEEDTVAGDVEDVPFLGSVANDQEQPWVTHINLSGHSTKFKVDTGADVTMISESMYLDLPTPPP